MPWNIHLTKLSWISLLGDGENRCFLVEFFALPCYEFFMVINKGHVDQPTGFFFVNLVGEKESSVPERCILYS